MRIAISGSVLAVTLVLFGCGNAKPCSGSSCIDVSGTYVATYDPELHCAAWAFHPAPSSSMVVTQSGSSVQVILTPSVESPVHSLSGMLQEGGAISVTEPTLDPSLGLPSASLSGTFTGDPSTLVFKGTLQFTSPNGAVDAGPQSDCSSAETVNAERTSGGEPADAGQPDAGQADAGHADAGADAG